MSGPDRAGIEGSREMRRESKALRAALLSWLRPRPTVPRRMRCRPGARFVFVVMCPTLGLARGGAGCQGGVRVVFLGGAQEARRLGAAGFVDVGEGTRRSCLRAQN